jgi:hypothetical protein
MPLLPFSSQLIADVGISLGDEGKGRLIPEVADELRGTPLRSPWCSRSTAAPTPATPPAASSSTSCPPVSSCGRRPPLHRLRRRRRPAQILVGGQAARTKGPRHPLAPPHRRAHDGVRPHAPPARPRLGGLPHPRPRRGTARLHRPRHHAGLRGRGRPGSRSPIPISSPARTTSPASSPSAPTARCAPSSTSAASRRRNSPASSTSSPPPRPAPTPRRSRPACSRSRVRFHASSAAPSRSRSTCRASPRLLGSRHRLAKNIGEVRELILRELAAGRTVIGEFGQAYWLDKRHGYSPNVTASHTYTPEFFESAGIPVQRIHTFGVAKAYDTKVGTHTFLTQMDDAPR